MKIKSFSIEKARKAQMLLAQKVVEKDDFPCPPQTVGGVDVAYIGNYAVAAAVVVEYDTLSVKEKSVSIVKVKFPYIPTLLSFRECYPMISAIKKLKELPDIFMVDAQGRLHPFRLGAASHLGVVLNIPTIGIAKKLLCGSIGERKDNWAPIYDKNEIIGAAVWTKKNVKPIFVSIGHRVTLKTAIKITLNTCKKYKLPEPIRQAHITATLKKRLVKEGVELG
ncbi:MAG: deoxyribonuclease V [Candidatus Baldrarchaeia archaeon]|nr:deoxyribonuclease V [Candidatus Baldrarchaeota archaeon]OYT26012.1 MAG: endonuclease V [Thermofilum sp. ex4484_82]OYT36627.1 MAG: endonuclease V [Archaeoglobales archaeon ex4484_92]